MVFLSELSADLLGCILAFDCVSHKSLSLFLTGSRLLQLKLSQGVTSVALRSRKKYLKAKLPNYLTALSKLRELRVSCNYEAFFDVKASVSVLKGVNSRLETLEMDFNGSESLLELSCPSPPFKPPRADVAALFPELRTLSVTSSSPGFQPGGKLPSSLTSLKLCVTVWDDMMTNLPPSLVNLEVNHLSDPCIASLPPNLQTLVCKSSLGHAHALLPKSLTHLHPTRDVQDLALPPLITAVDASFLRFQRIDPSELLRALPKTLLSLANEDIYFVLPLSHLNLLPRTLQSLYASFSETSTIVSTNDWPPHLKSLNLKGRFPTYNSFWSTLPPALTTLRLGGAYLSLQDIASLPRTLLDLDATLGGDDLIDEEISFPPRLHTLSLQSAHSPSLFHTVLPQSITDLKLIRYKLSYEALRTCLPDRLRRLMISEVFSDKSLRSSSKKALNAERAQKLLEIGLEDDCLDESEKRLLQSKIPIPNVSIIDFLPRTLDTLHFKSTDGWKALKAEEWSRLPKFLKSIQFDSQALSPAVLLHMPVAHLELLTITLDSISAEHLKRLPRNLSRLNVTVDQYSLSADVALAAPPDVYASWQDWRRDNGDGRDEHTMMELDKKRKAAVLAGNKEELLALGLGPDYYAC